MGKAGSLHGGVDDRKEVLTKVDLTALAVGVGEGADAV